MSKYSENIPEDAKGTLGWMIDDIKPNSSLLDFGCSTGYFGEIIKRINGVKVYGIEVSDDVKKAEKVLDGVYSFDLDGEWPKQLYERSYDYIFMGDILEHLKNPGLTLEKSLKLLKTKGKIFVSTPNIAHISTRLELMTGNFTYEKMGILDNTHLKYFTLKSFTDMANEAGYKVSSVNYALNDFPHELIKRWLAKIGLEPNAKFWKEVESVEARAFQFKVILEPASSKAKQRKIPTLPLPEKPQQFRDEYIRDFQKLASRVHELNLATKAQGDELDRLRGQIAQQKAKQAKRPSRKILKLIRSSKGKKQNNG